MLQHIEEKAELCIARGCGFAALGIFTFMVGLSWDLALASEVGGLLTLAACVVLLHKAHRALDRPVQKTELWMTLAPDLRPRAAVAQRMLGQVLYSCYLRFAVHAAALSASLLALAFALQVLRGQAPELLPVVGLVL